MPHRANSHFRVETTWGSPHESVPANRQPPPGPSLWARSEVKLIESVSEGSPTEPTEAITLGRCAKRMQLTCRVQATCRRRSRGESAGSTSMSARRVTAINEHHRGIDHASPPAVNRAEGSAEEDLGRFTGQTPIAHGTKCDVARLGHPTDTFARY
jgi:hypothetical protein